MAGSELPRTEQKIFGSTGATTEFGRFGSKAAGSPVTTKDLDDIQSLAQYSAGWYSATANSSEPPRIQDRNALDLLFASQLAYLFQVGIPEWENSATERYYADKSVVTYNGVVYMAILGDDVTNINIQKNPSTETSWWQQFVPYMVSKSGSGSTSIALDHTAIASGSNSVSVGAISQATGSQSVSHGYFARATATDATAIGGSSEASNTGGATALGRAAIASGQGSAALAGYSDATGLNSLACGVGAQALTARSTAVGQSADAITAENTTAIGQAALSSALDATSVGQGAISSASSATSVGRLSSVVAADSDAFGAGATIASGATASTSIGRASSISSADCVAVGVGATIPTSAADSVVVGRLATVSGANSVSVGANSDAAATCVAVGENAQVGASGSVGIGQGVSITPTYAGSVAVGNSSIVSGLNATSIGAGSDSGVYSVAVGYGAQIDGQDSVGIGRNVSSAPNQTITIGSGVTNNELGSILVGYGTSISAASASPKAVIIGTGASSTISSTGGTYQSSVVIGDNATHSATASAGISIGEDSESGNNSIAIGSASDASATAAVAIGIQSTAASLGIALGNNTTAGANECVIGENAASGINTVRCYGGTYTTYSDRRDKIDIAPMNIDSMAMLRKLEPKQFRMNFRAFYQEKEEYTDVQEIEVPNIVEKEIDVEVPNYIEEEYEDERIVKIPILDEDGKPTGKYKDGTETIIRTRRVQDGMKTVKRTKRSQDGTKTVSKESKRNRFKRDENGELIYDKKAHEKGEQARKRLHAGFIAQDVDEFVGPDGISLVKKRQIGAPNMMDEWSLDYEQFIPILWDVCQKQQAMIETLQSQVAALS